MLTPPTHRFEDLLLAELGRLERFAAARFGPSADDVVQETLLRALRAQAKFDSSREMWPWLRMTAIRTAQQRYANEGRLGAVPLSEAVEGPIASGRDGAIGQLLDRLRPMERDAMDRFYLRGHSVAEIAAERQCPQGTVKSQLSRARKRLAGVLGASALLALGCFAVFGPPRSPAPRDATPPAPPHSASIRVQHERGAPARFLRIDRSHTLPPKWTVTGATIVRAGLIQPDLPVTRTQSHR